MPECRGQERLQKSSKCEPEFGSAWREQIWTPWQNKLFPSHGPSLGRWGLWGAGRCGKYGKLICFARKTRGTSAFMMNISLVLWSPALVSSFFRPSSRSTCAMSWWFRGKFPWIFHCIGSGSLSFSFRFGISRKRGTWGVVQAEWENCSEGWWQISVCMKMGHVFFPIQRVFFMGNMMINHETNRGSGYPWVPHFQTDPNQWCVKTASFIAQWLSFWPSTRRMINDKQSLLMDRILSFEQIKCKLYN